MTCARIALALNVLGTIGVGVIPVIGMATAYGGSIKFRSIWWKLSWWASWLIFLVGVALSAFVCRLTWSEM